ncbi:MAG: hypothetical protein J6T64_01425, partial [Bacteroidaceae bacterium]|nr:hypothetical protein [Bacteroidaceae bacterium]
LFVKSKDFFCFFARQALFLQQKPPSAPHELSETFTSKSAQKGAVFQALRTLKIFAKKTPI